jgi:hypothetical protein
MSFTNNASNLSGKSTTNAFDVIANSLIVSQDALIKGDLTVLGNTNIGDVTLENANVNFLTVNNLTATNPIPTTSGGTGLATIGSPNQVLTVNPSGTALYYQAPTLINPVTLTGTGFTGTPTFNFGIETTGSGTDGKGFIRTSSTAFGLDIQTQGTSKYIKLISDTVTLPTTTTPSTNTSSGALVVTGDVGIGGKINLGSTLNTPAAITAASTYTSFNYVADSVSLGPFGLPTSALLATGRISMNGVLNIPAPFPFTDNSSLTFQPAGGSFSSFGFPSYDLRLSSGSVNTFVGPATPTSLGITAQINNRVNSFENVLSGVPIPVASQIENINNGYQAGLAFGGSCSTILYTEFASGAQIITLNANGGSGGIGTQGLINIQASGGLAGSRIIIGTTGPNTNGVLINAASGNVQISPTLGGVLINPAAGNVQISPTLGSIDLNANNSVTTKATGFISFKTFASVDLLTLDTANFQYRFHNSGGGHSLSLDRFGAIFTFPKTAVSPVTQGCLAVNTPNVDGGNIFSLFNPALTSASLLSKFFGKNTTVGNSIRENFQYFSDSDFRNLYSIGFYNTSVDFIEVQKGVNSGSGISTPEIIFNAFSIIHNYLPASRAITFDGSNLATSYTWKWPSDMGTNGQILTTNGSNTLTWTSQPILSIYVTSVSATSPIISSGGTTPTISISPTPSFGSTTINGDLSVTGFIKANSNNVSNTSTLNPPITVFNFNGFQYGMDLGYSTISNRYRTRIFCPNSGNADISLATVNVSPTGQSDFTDRIIVNGTNGDISLVSKTFVVSSISTATGAPGFSVINDNVNPLFTAVVVAPILAVNNTMFWGLGRSLSAGNSTFLSFTNAATPSATWSMFNSTTGIQQFNNGQISMTATNTVIRSLLTSSNVLARFLLPNAITTGNSSTIMIGQADALNASTFLSYIYNSTLSNSSAIWGFTGSSLPRFTLVANGESSYTTNTSSFTTPSFRVENTNIDPRFTGAILGPNMGTGNIISFAVGKSLSENNAATIRFNSNGTNSTTQWTIYNSSTYLEQFHNGDININGSPNTYINSEYRFTSTPNAAFFTKVGGPTGSLNACGYIFSYAHYITTLTSGGLIEFFAANGTTAVGNISTNGSNLTFNNTSDSRLKTNIVPVSNILNLLDQIQPVSFSWKNNPEISEIGFIADDLYNIIPALTSGTPNKVNEDGKPEYMTVAYGSFSPYLVAAIQELYSKIKILESKVATLENNL